MHARTRLLLSALVAALALSAAVTAANARRFELSNQHFRAVWNPTIDPASGKLTFSEAAEFVEIRCNVTIEGSFHSRTLSKVSGQLVGYVTRASLESCEGGAAIILPETLPWHIRFDSFTGTLPNITTIRAQLINVSFLVRILNTIECLYRSTAEGPAYGRINIGAGGVVNTLSAENGSAIPLRINLRPERGPCPATGTFSGNAIVRLQGSLNTRIIVRLVQ